MFICGPGNFPDDDAKLSRRPNKNHNPYADRGLDKFYALLADLDDKKQKIYTRLGSEDISFVRFVYANDNSNHVKPIVVKVKGKTSENANTRKNNDPFPLIKRINRSTTNENKNEILPENEENEETCQKRKKKYMIRCNGESIPFSWINRLKQPCWYFVAVVVLIMVLLAVFGRSFAILCTSIGWYLVPTVVGEGSSSSSVERKPKRKKEYAKKLTSDLNNQSTSTSAINGLPNNRKIQKLQHGQKKKFSSFQRYELVKFHICSLVLFSD